MSQVKRSDAAILQAGKILQEHQIQEAVTLTWMYASSNDDYGGRPVARLAASVEALLWGLTEYNLDDVSEVIIVEWVADRRMQRLNDAPEIKHVWQQYTGLGRKRRSKTKVRILSVFQEDTEPFVSPTLKRMSEVHSLNAAAQRAHGAFLLRLDQDTLVGTSFFKFLLQEQAQGWPHIHEPWFSGRRECDEHQSAEIYENPVAFVSNAKNGVHSGDGPTHEHRMGGPVGVVGVPALEAYQRLQ